MALRFINHLPDRPRIPKPAKIASKIVIPKPETIMPVQQSSSDSQDSLMMTDTEWDRLIETKVQAALAKRKAPETKVPEPYNGNNPALLIAEGLKQAEAKL